VDTTKVTLRLSVLEALLKRYVKEEEYTKLFSSAEGTLKFNGQAAPLKKGRNQRIVKEVPESTMQYAMAALKKLHTPAPKRLAVEFERTSPGISETLPPAVTPVARSSANTLPQSSPTEDQRILSVEKTLQNQNTRLLNLEQCCNLLATSTKNLENQLTSMNNSFFTKMDQMAKTLDHLNAYPNRKHTKVSKPSDDSIMDIGN
jgi:hypothetical protein